MAVIAGWIALRPGPEGPSPATSEKPVRILVLPFDNLGDPEDAYFASGVTEEIANRLAGIQGVAVLSRTTAQIVKNSPRTAAEMGVSLGVGYVLEGSIRSDKTEGRVRITPQLVRTSDESRIWSRAYDHAAEDLFAVQSEIATEVLEALRVTVLDSERKALVARPTESVEAHNAYLAGLHYWNGNVVDRDVDWRLAADLFERAVELDRDFGDAWAALSEASSWAYQQGYDRSGERRRLAEEAAGQAERIAPQEPTTFAARANVYRRIHRDYERAYQALAPAVRARPNDLFLQWRLTAISERRGDWQETLRVRKRIFELDPSVNDGAWGVARCLRQLRLYDEAERYLDRALRDRPDWTFGYAHKAQIQRLSGDLAGARATLEAMPKTDMKVPVTVQIWFDLGMVERDFPRVLGRLSSDPREWIEHDSLAWPKSLMEGLARLYSGDSEGAGIALGRAAKELELRVEKDGGDHRLHSALGLAYAGLGHKQEAIRAGLKGVELMPVSLDAWLGPRRVEDLAHIYALAGEPELALERLGELLGSPSPFSLASLELEPRWDSLRAHPRYGELVQKYR